MPESRGRLTGSRALFVLVTVVLLAPVATGSLTRAIASGEDKEDSFYREFTVLTEVLEHIRKRYVEETGLDALFAGAFDGAADALGPMATYVPEDSVATYREALAHGIRRSGLQLVRERGILFVVGVAPGSPGAEAGLRSGDILSKLNGRSTRLTPLWEAQVIFAGEPGTELAIDVLRQGQPMEFELKLGEFEPEGPTVEIREGVALLRITHFEPGLVEQLESLLESPEVVASSGRVILDLRSVAGGDFGTALAAADLFVDGELGELRGRSEVVETYASARESIWSGRLVLLTDRGSQGASEVFAVVLRQLAEAATVGGGTFGHAGRTTSRTLSDGAELYYTDAFYVAPDGTVLDAGLSPDYRVTGSSLRLSDTDRSFDDLVIERAIDIARGEEQAEKEAA
ncbi:MAG: PDZ domain-containing protein [bacterium]|nr:PDZ domain-containing protein [bacterium]